MSASDDTTDAVAEAREMIAAFEVISGGRTRYEGQPEREDERYDRNRRALVARIENLEAMCASYVDTIGKCNAENADLEAKLAEQERRATNEAVARDNAELRCNDLESKLAAMTRERDAACYAALEMPDVIKDLQAALETRTAPPQ